MLMCYTSNDFPNDYVPTVFDNYVATVAINNKTISLGLWDTAGQEEFDSLRPLSYPGTDIFLLCFCVIYEPSYTNLRDKWKPEVMKHCPNALMMVVGTKMDLRDNAAEIKKVQDQGMRILTPEDGEKLMDELGCSCYMECSALTRKGLKEVFDKACTLVLDHNAEQNKPENKEKNRKKCVML